MMKPVKSTGVAAHSFNGSPSNGNGKTASKNTAGGKPRDNTLEFDFGAVPTSIAKEAPPLAPTVPVTPVKVVEATPTPSEPIEAPVAAPAPAKDPVTVIKMEPAPVSRKDVPSFSEGKLRIHHTATPSGPVDYTKPSTSAPTASAYPRKPAGAGSASVSTGHKPFSASSIKITDLTGELSPEEPAKPAAATTPAAPAKASIPMPEPEPSPEPEKPKEPAAPIAATPAKTTPASKFTPPTVSMYSSSKRTASTTPTTPAKTEVRTTASVVKNEPKPETKTEFKSEPKVESQPAPKAEAKSEARPELKSESKAQPKTTVAATESHPGPAAVATHITTEKETSTARNSTMALNPPTVSDFRKNAERQAKEQKAVGSLLSWVGYTLLGGLIFVAVLAGFGGYTMLRMIEKQNATVAQLESHYNDLLAKQQADIAQLRADADKSNDQLAAAANLMARQQEQLKRTAASADETSALLKARSRELADVRERVRRLEGGRPTSGR